jgi:CubicO group peptidase (beta-lactamase class C family)
MYNWTKGILDSTSKEARYDDSRLELLADYYKRLVDSGRVQSAGFLLARDGKVFAHQVLGRLTHKKDSPLIRPDSLKGIMSISKVLTATAIMKLVEDGRLWLEQPLHTIFPEFNTELHRSINIRHLLTHTSGLPADAGYFAEPYPVKHWELYNCDDWLKVVLSGPLQSHPGETWSYCSIGFGILAEVVSRVSGKHFYDYMQENIFVPLGMTRSFFEVPENLFPEICLWGDWELQELAYAKQRPKRAPRGAGGAFSTLHDLFKFGQCFLNGGTYNNARILGKTTVATMTRNQLDGIPACHWGKHLTNYRFGLGWEFFCDGSTVAPETYSHEGLGWSSLFIEPNEKFIYISFVADEKGWDPEVMVKPRVMAWSGIQ